MFTRKLDSAHSLWFKLCHQRWLLSVTGSRIHIHCKSGNITETVSEILTYQALW